MPQTAPPSDRRVRRAPSSSTRALSRREFGYDHARHLLWRAGFGGTPEQVRAMAEMGPYDAVDFLLDFESSRESYAGPSSRDFDPDIMAPISDAQRRAYREAQRQGDEDTLAAFRQARQQRQQRDRAQVRSVQRWWLTRLVESPRPLEEKLTLFWHGHFATAYRGIENSYHMFLQNQLFRHHAAGNFGEMLFSIIRDPAMLAYLNNDRNRRGAPNENLARELMELFSLGEGNYSERDIKEGARALTGYTYSHNSFVFNESQHDGGRKNILGTSGQLDGDGFVEAILSQRACSEFIASKLYEFFVAKVPVDRRDIRYRPAVSVIKSLASTLREHRYALKPALRKLFLSDHFYDPINRNELIKSPVDLVVGSVRSLRTPVRDLDVMLDALELMGQEPLQPPNVAGWPGGRTWINTSTLFIRQNILAFMITGVKPVGFDPLATADRYDPTEMVADLAAAELDPMSSPQSTLPYLLRFMIGGDPQGRHLQILTDYIDEHGGTLSRRNLTAAMAIITAMPEYQLM